MTTITAFFPDTDRYNFDFGLCADSKGWAQVDTTQDASYYGTWTNPARFQLFTYCEGDTTLKVAEDAEEYACMLRGFAAWAKGAGYWKGIDTINPASRAILAACGLAHYLR